MRRWIVLLACLLPVNSQLAFGADQTVSGNVRRIRWSELTPFILQGEVRIDLPSGGFVQGRAMAVRSDELAIMISKSSDQRAYPKGQGAVPRNLITTIRHTQMKGSVGRTVFTIVGVFAGAGIMAAVIMGTQADNTSGDAGARVGVLAGLVGAGVGGYYAGKSFDRKTTIITVLPD